MMGHEVNGALSFYTISNPAIRGSYDFSIANVTGVVAANNYVSLFNPVGSGRVISFGGGFVSSTSAGATSETAPMRGLRITAASAGTLVPASDIAKFSSASPNATAEVRTGNPTVTLGAAIFNSPPTISGSVGSTVVHQIAVPPGAGPFTFAPGEGVVLRTEAGDADQRWNLSLVWVEL